MTKLTEFCIGQKIIKNFCRLNKIKPPEIVNSDKIAHIGYFSFETPDSIYVNLKQCGKSTKNNNPMMVYENTVIGTMLHEFGHYLHFNFHKKLTRKFESIRKEPMVHYYERNIDEDIAECIRIAILNPRRLSAGRQKRYRILADIFVLDVIYTPVEIVKAYNRKQEKIDIDAWELFLV